MKYLSDIRSITRHKVLGVEKAELVGTYGIFHRQVRNIYMFLSDFEKLWQNQWEHI